jgi:hypothetical protein
MTHLDLVAKSPFTAILGSHEPAYAGRQAGTLSAFPWLVKRGKGKVNPPAGRAVVCGTKTEEIKYLYIWTH